MRFRRLGRPLEGPVRTWFLLLAANALKISLVSLFLVHDRHLRVLAYKLPVTAALLLLLGVLLVRLPRPALAALYLVQTLFLYATLNYYLRFGSFLHVHQGLQLLGEGFTVLAGSAMPHRVESLILLIDLPFLLLAWKGLGALRQGMTPILPLPWAAACLLVLAAAEALNLSQGKSIFHEDHRYEAASMVRRYGTLANALIDLAQFPGEQAVVASIRYGQEQEIPDRRPESRPDIVCIQVESLGSGLLEAEHGGTPAAPFLRSLMDSAIYYPYLLSYHFAGGSSDAEFATLNGVEPFGNFVAFKLRNYGYPNSVVKALCGKGYRALAFHGNHRDFYNRNAAYHAMGFETFLGIERAGLREIGWGAPDGDLLEFAARRIENSREPLFSYIITISMHEPFDAHRLQWPANPFPDMAPGPPRRLMRATSYVDAALSRFVARVRASRPGVWIFIWGDHVSGVRSDVFIDEAVRIGSRRFEFVPLFIIAPDDRAYREDSLAAGYLDIPLSILHASGGGYRYRSLGGNLLEPGSLSTRLPFLGRPVDRKALFRSAEAHSTANRRNGSAGTGRIESALQSSRPVTSRRPHGEARREE